MPLIISALLLIILLLLILRFCNFHSLADKLLNRKFLKTGMHSDFFSVGENTNMHFWKGGKGRPLLLLHGFGASAKYQWEKQIKDFSKGRSLIIPDLIYFGKSTSCNGEYSIDFQVDCILKLLDFLQLDSFDIVGLSYGGLLAVSIADKCPDKVGSIVVCDSPVRFFSEEDVAKVLKSFQVDSLQNLLLPPKKEGLKDLLRISFSKPPVLPFFVLKEVHEGIINHQLEDKKKLLNYLNESRKELNQRNFNLVCNVLLLWGREDALIPVHVGEQLNDFFGENASLVVMENAAHMPNMEQPEVYNKIVLDFLIER